MTVRPRGSFLADTLCWRQRFGIPPVTRKNQGISFRQPGRTCKAKGLWHPAPADLRNAGCRAVSFSASARVPPVSLSGEIVEIINLPIERVIPYARNPRHNAEAVAKVAASIAEYGWRQPIVVDRDMVVVAGHTRLEAARRLGLATVPVHVATDLTPAQARAYRLMDNRSHQEARWNDELLALELKDLRIDAVDLTLTGFDAGEIDQILATLDDTADQDADAADSTDPDATPEPPSDPVTRPGDLWLLGEHRRAMRETG